MYKMGSKHSVDVVYSMEFLLLFIFVVLGFGFNQTVFTISPLWRIMTPVPTTQSLCSLHYPWIVSEWATLPFFAITTFIAKIFASALQ